MSNIRVNLPEFQLGDSVTFPEETNGQSCLSCRNQEVGMTNSPYPISWNQLVDRFPCCGLSSSARVGVVSIPLLTNSTRVFLKWIISPDPSGPTMLRNTWRNVCLILTAKIWKIVTLGHVLSLAWNKGTNNQPLSWSWTYQGKNWLN